MRLRTALNVSSICSSALAVNLYVTSYAGTVSSLSLTRQADGKYSFNTVSVNTGSLPTATWLEKDKRNGVIYGLDESFATPNGSVVTYTTSESGKLTVIDAKKTLGGPVSSIVYNGGKGLAVAHYGGSALTSWTTSKGKGVTSLQNFVFTLPGPGTIPSRQEAPHPHEALVDPTDKFILVPDLGADLLRVFSIDPATSKLTERKAFATPPGSGPRHGKFYVHDDETYFFLVSELSNTVTSYSVSYDTKYELGFTQVSTSGIYGNETTPIGAAAAEGILSPDKRYFLTSSRNATIFQIPNYDPANSTTIPSDTLQVWSIDRDTGKLSFKQIAPAGGSFPRQFSINKNGTLAAVVLQRSSRVVIVKRDVKSGLYGDFVANVGVEGEVTAVIWDE